MKKIKKFLSNCFSSVRGALNDLGTLIKSLIINNRLFLVFISIAVINATLLRFLTINTIENALSFKAIVADLIIAVLWGSFSYLLKPKYRFIYLLIWEIILTLICVINSCYYTFYTSFSSVSFLATSKFVSDMDSSVVLNIVQLKDMIYLLGIGVLIYYHVHFKKKYSNYLPVNQNKLTRKRNFTKIILIDAVILFGIVLTLTPLEASRLTKQWNREWLVMKFGIYTYHINDFIKSIEPKLNSFFGYDTAVKVFNDYYNAYGKDNSRNEYTNIFKDKNVLVIHAESVQTFALNTSFNGIEVTPYLNKLRDEGLYFNNFYSQVSVGTSSDTEFTFNTGLLPVKSGTVNVNYFDRKYIATPSLLGDLGYYTFSMHGNTGDFWNRNIMHKNLGYDDFFSKNSYTIDTKIGLGLSDKSFFAQSIEKIKEISEKNEKYYGLLITLTNHTPFDALDLYGEFDVDIKESVYNEETNNYEIMSYTYMEGTKMGNYFKSLHYADQAIGEFISGLDAEGLLENTVVVIYGDHDARLASKDFNRFYNYDKETDDILNEEDPNYTLFDTYQYELNRKVPFIIWTKNSKGNKLLDREISTPMGMFNAANTLGNMLGFENKYALGEDIFNNLDDNLVVFANSNFLTNKVYYNSQKEEYLVLSDSVVIGEEYISKCIQKSLDMLEVSNSIIVYDLIKKQALDVVDETEVIGVK